MGHSIYGFLRNEEYYNNLNNMINYNILNINKKYIYIKIKSFILSKNLNQLHYYLQSLTSVELNYIQKNHDKILNLFKQFGWKKGEKLYQLMIVELKMMNQ